MFLCVLPHRYIANCSRYQDALGTIERAQHDLDGKLAAILALADEFDAGADLLRQSFGRCARSIGDQAFRKTLRDDALYSLTQKLVAPISELFLCTSIQKDNLSALVYDHHSIRRRLKKPPIPGLHLRQMFFRIFAHGNVANGRRH